MLGIMDRHLLESLNNGLQAFRVELEMRFGILRIRNADLPVGIVATDEFDEEAPPPAAELYQDFRIGVRNVRNLHFPFSIEIELSPCQELVSRDDERLTEGEVEGVAGEQVSAIGPNHVVGLRIAGIHAYSGEDVTVFIRAGAGHGINESQAKVLGDRKGFSFDPGDLRELLNGWRFGFGLSELSDEIELDAEFVVGIGFQVDPLALVAGLHHLLQGVEEDEERDGLTFGRLFESQGHKPVEVGGSETNPSVLRTLDFEALQDGEGTS